jgi:putative resolvase
MKRKEYARQQGVSSRTAWRWWKAGKRPGQQMDTGTIRMELEPPATPRVSPRVAIAARVSSAAHKRHLDRQAERLNACCAARGEPVAQGVNEVGSGVKDARPKLLALLADPRIGLNVVEPKDRLTRFGVRSLDILLKTQGRAIEVR